MDASTTSDSDFWTILTFAFSQGAHSKTLLKDLVCRLLRCAGLRYLYVMLALVCSPSVIVMLNSFATLVKNNPESETFQFVIRAGIRGLSGDTAVSRASMLAHDNDELQRKLILTEREVAKLRSNLEWIEQTTMFSRMHAVFRRMFVR